MADLIGRKQNKAGVTYDPGNKVVLYAEDWNNSATLLEGLNSRVSALEINGAPGSKQVKLGASGYPTMTLDITSGVEAEITMDGNTSLRIAYTQGASNFAILYIKQRPGGTITWPSMSWDTVDGKAPVLSKGDGLLDVIGVYERFGVLRGAVIDKALRAAAPQVDVPVESAVLQYLFDEGSGFPRDTSGKGNHITVFGGTWNPGGGVNFTSSQYGRTDILRDLDPNDSWWDFRVYRDMSTFGGNHAHGGLSSSQNLEGTENHYLRYGTNGAGDSVAIQSRSRETADYSVMQAHSKILPASFRTAVVYVFDKSTGRHSQYVMHNSDRSGYATSNGMKWRPEAMYMLSGHWRQAMNGGAGAWLAGSGNKLEYCLMKQGLPEDTELAAIYNFCKDKFASRPGANLP